MQFSNRLLRLVVVPCTLAALALAGCDGEGGGTSSDGGSDTGGGNAGGNSNGGSSNGGASNGGASNGGASNGGSDTGGGSAESGWGESEPGITKGPFGYFKAFHSGCGGQVWMRFIPQADFALGKVNISAANGTGLQITYFEVPVFLKNEKSVYLVDQQENWDAASATFNLTVQNPDDSVLTHSIDAPLDKLFRWPGQIDYVSAYNDSFDGLQITIDPKISGSVIRMFVHDLESECPVYSQTLLDEGAKITKGTPTELDVGAKNLTPGKDYLLILQGVDTARDYIYYATLEFKAP